MSEPTYFESRKRFVRSGIYLEEAGLSSVVACGGRSTRTAMTMPD